MLKAGDKKAKTSEVAREASLDPLAQKLQQQRIADEGDPKSSEELFTESGNEKSLDNLIPKSETDFLEYANFISQKLHQYEGVHLRVVGVCDSKSLLVASDVLTTELDDTSLTEVCQVKLKGSSLLTLGNSGQSKVFSNPEAMGKIIDVATLLGRSTGLAFIDCSASSEPIGVLNRVVDLGCCVVMANKKPLTSSMEDYDKLLAYPRRIRHESTVSTLGYVMSELEDGKPFSQVVKSAKRLGYTEPGALHHYCFDGCEAWHGRAQGSF
ncbi:hypothetical protein ACSBR2_040688 [Camellia fascicularis]